jgi:hypothetical protein
MLSPILTSGRINQCVPAESFRASVGAVVALGSFRAFVGVACRLQSQLKNYI